MAKTAYVVSLFSELTILREYRAIREAVCRGFTSEFPRPFDDRHWRPSTVEHRNRWLPTRHLAVHVRAHGFVLVSRRPSTEAIDNGARKR